MRRLLLSNNFDVGPNLEYLYETTRKSKQYRRNTIIERIQLRDVFTTIKENNIEAQGINLRIFYYQFSDQTREQLQKDYCSEFLTHFFSYQRSFNLRSSIISAYDDSNLSIYDIELAPLYDTNTVLQYLNFILSLDATQFCSRLEIAIVNTIANKIYYFYYETTRYNAIDQKYYTIQGGVKLTASINSIRVSAENIDKWVGILEEKWDILYADIYNKALTVRCQSDLQSDLITRRYFDKQEIVFDNYLDLANAIYQHNIIEFIPNVHTTEYELIEAVVDFDTAKVMDYEDIKLISDLFEEFLRNKKMVYLRRLTGGKRGGQHFILPVAFSEPILLAGRPVTYERYKIRRKKHEMIIDSAKDTFFSLCLLFQQEYSNESVINKTTMHLRDPTERHHKMLFDIIAGSQRGRRSVFSLHNGSGNVCVPIRTLPDTLKETNQLVDINFVNENIREYNEDVTIWDLGTRTQNYFYLKNISLYSVNILRDYYKLSKHQFNNKIFK